MGYGVKMAIQNSFHQKIPQKGYFLLFPESELSHCALVKVKVGALQIF